MDTDKKQAIQRVILDAVPSYSEQWQERNLFPAADCRPKQIQNAIKSFARDCKPEDAVLLIDTSFMHSGKKGFLFTSECLYVDDSQFEKDIGGRIKKFPVPLRYEDLEKVNLLRRMGHTIALHYKDREKIFVVGKYMPLLSHILERVVEELKEWQDAGSGTSHGTTAPPKETAVDPHTASVVGAAEYRCGLIYETGEGGMKINKATALGWYLKAAEYGHAEAQFRCGEMYEKGEGTSANEEKALHWYLKAAEQGHAEAQHRGSALCDRIYDDIYDENYGKILYDEKTGRILNKEKYDYDVKATVLRWYLAAAKQGRAEAQYRCGRMYETGEGVPASAKSCLKTVDNAEALRWYLKAAEQGHLEAQFRCGHIYDHVENDKAAALPWFLKAAEQGHADAQCRCGVIYDKKDKAEALRWFLKAAEQGMVAAYLNCYRMYSKGEGMAVDTVKAEFYRQKILKAADEGDALASYFMENRFV